MLIGFSVYRAKNNELIESGNVRVDIGDVLDCKEITSETQLIFVDKFIAIIYNVLTQYISETTYTKKYGIGYIRKF